MHHQRKLQLCTVPLPKLNQLARLKLLTLYHWRDRVLLPAEIKSFPRSHGRKVLLIQEMRHVKQVIFQPGEATAEHRLRGTMDSWIGVQRSWYQSGERLLQHSHPCRPEKHTAVLARRYSLVLWLRECKKVIPPLPELHPTFLLAETLAASIWVLVPWSHASLVLWCSSQRCQQGWLLLQVKRKIIVLLLKLQTFFFLLKVFFKTGTSKWG